MKKNKTFIISLFNKEQNTRKEIPYTLVDNIIAEKWFKSMKHLKSVPPYEHESNHRLPRKIEEVYDDFCEVVGIEPKVYDQIDQQALNDLHALFMEFNDTLAHSESKHILYEFHQAIHYTEFAGPHSIHKKHYKFSHTYQVNYNFKGGPFVKKIACNRYYSTTLSKNNLYLTYSDSGKKPYNYFYDGEPNEWDKVRATMTAHVHFRPNWFICLKDRFPEELPDYFYQFFEPYRHWFLDKYSLEKWDHVDEYSAVPLAVHSGDQDVSFLIKKGGYQYEKLHSDFF